ncbi:hypothetical protein NPIL_115231 [Nephila pilipes]|uniref:RING-type domain-containing protein n=1 Tax=Nephila pilipes TaxID=299642 RepID=A0A8X6P8T2_NEPPI|nr:hypothetical protein NPIL_115231 [Nephila pilipes]
MTIKKTVRVIPASEILKNAIKNLLKPDNWTAPVPVPKFGCAHCDEPDGTLIKKKIWLSCGHVVHYDCINCYPYSMNDGETWACPVCIVFVKNIGILYC